MTSGVVETVVVRSADGTAIACEVSGRGPALVIVHGSLRAAHHYRALAGALAEDFTVYVMDRRGRGGSGPQGAAYGIDSESDDLAAVLAHGNARLVFGHSYGGVVALETMLRRPDTPITRLAVYEPAVSLHGTISNEWLPELQLAVAEGRTADGLISIISGLELAGTLKHVPVRMRRAMVKVVMRGTMMSDMEALLPTVHAEVATATGLDSDGAKFAGIATDTLLMAGERGPDYLRNVVAALADVMPNARLAILPKLTHNAPDLDAPAAVAAHLRRYFG
jgi:pimeloyl-ACP methyl ester carboxylesterase